MSPITSIPTTVCRKRIVYKKVSTVEVEGSATF